MIPKLRFPGFRGEWEAKRLGDAARKKLSNGVFNDPAKVGSGYRLINVKDMYVDGFIDSRALTKVAISSHEFERNKVNTGDIFFTRSSLVKEGIAFTNIYQDHEQDITYDGHLIKLSPNIGGNSPTFLYYLTKTSAVRKQLVSFGNTTTMTTIGQNEVSSVPLQIPKKDEQEKIAEFLSVVDERIAAMDKKVQLLQQYKKGIMQKIFTQKLRFKDEDGNDYPAWQTKKLGSLVDIKTGKKDVNQGNPHGRYPFFTCAREHTYSDEYSFEGEAIMIAGNGEVGLCTYYDGKFEAYQRTYVLQNFSQPGGYLFIYLKSAFQEFAESQKQQGSMPYIKLATLQNFPIPTQDENEQQKIADFLAGLDDKINLEKTKLDQAKLFKKSLLQRMFV